MKKKIAIITILAILTVSLCLGWTNTYNTATPANSDSPTEAAVRMREIKAATQERMNVDHLWQLTSTQVSDANVGEHRKLTLTYTSAAELAAFTSGKAYVYRYLNELYYKDANGTGDTYTTQITKLGKLNLDDSRLSNNTYLVGRNVAGSANINIIKVNDSNTLTLGAITILPDGSTLATSAAPDANEEIANKKYVDDSVSALGSYSDGSVMSITWPYVDTTTTTSTDIASTLATTDGFLLCINYYSAGSSGICRVDGYTDAANPPTNIRQVAYAREYAGWMSSSFCMPVKKGDYFKAEFVVTSGTVTTISRTYNWIPLGN